ncbi:hypothetical protein [Actinomycetospora atypica]|uniref:Uncharacterized protein n=1 Tax=Actinomycetospora atypica TaxID=1290095 RepID=A0ABV9YTS7_9PSEU
MSSSAAELSRLTGLPLAEVRGMLPDDGLVLREHVVALQRLLLRRELGLPDDASVDPAALPAVLEAVRDRLDRQIAAVRAAHDGADDPAVLLDGFGPEPLVDEASHELARAWARTWTAGEPVDGQAARELAHRHRALVGTDLPEALAAVLDRHGHGAAAYARDVLAVSR